MQDFWGVLNEEVLRRNFVLVYEIVDEVCEKGYLQRTATEDLKTFIFSQPAADVSLTDKTVMHALHAAPDADDSDDAADDAVAAAGNGAAAADAAAVAAGAAVAAPPAASAAVSFVAAAAAASF